MSPPPRFSTLAAGSSYRSPQQLQYQEQPMQQHMATFPPPPPPPQQQQQVVEMREFQRVEHSHSPNFQAVTSTTLRQTVVHRRPAPPPDAQRSLPLPSTTVSFHELPTSAGDAGLPAPSFEAAAAAPSALAAASPG